ncbi:DUF4435 domain-containing protein [Polaribacter sp. AHE13PA]|uniref:DUF4435 domain-containing protein n=1 Tax=Polaribacter sp. AHE13PA TaxID=2745562 RepID=UPI001C4F628C|nr:DUF4435 domain-containing protein [Polaribacter sp. AHE13PA]QXP65836.1 DUF4435 domain-containing protein [Polaribacter sp. AHE13PA]
MITVEESMPVKNDNYRAGEDIFYVQFNDISFYIEDEDQENFFFCILKNLFPTIHIEKIFPLNGKENVVRESLLNTDNKEKVYIVDKDFDDILDKIVENPNLFYLERYSIENHLLEKDTLVEYIIGEKPKLNRNEIEASLDIEATLFNISKSLKNLVRLHLIVQNTCSHLKNISLNHERFLNFNNGQFDEKEPQIASYENDIDRELKLIDGRYSINSQRNKSKRLISLETLDLCIKHMPGKYLLKMLKQIIESDYGLVSRNMDSFCYRIATNCSFNSLENLRTEINDFVE